MLLGCGSSRGRCTESTHCCQCRWPVWRRRLSQECQARAVSSTTAARLVPLPRRPSYASGPRSVAHTARDCAWRGAWRCSRPPVHRPCIPRRRRVPTVCRLSTPSPRRVVAQEGGKPRQAQVPLPRTEGARCGGRWTARTPVFAGCMGRPKRCTRFGLPSMTRWASASPAQPRSTSSAQRVTQHRPCLRGGPPLPTHASRTSCRNPLATRGDTPPPCGVPLSGALRAPASSTPAGSHGPIHRTMPPSCTLCCLNARRWLQASVSQPPRPSASTLQVLCSVRHGSRRSWSAWCCLCPVLTPWEKACKAGRAESCQAHHHRPLDTCVRQAGVPSGPRLAGFVLEPHPRDRRRHLRLGAPPRRPLAPGLVQLLRVLRRRDRVQAWGPALVGLGRGVPQARPRPPGRHVVAPQGRRGRGLRCHALEWHGDGWCARRLSQRSCPQNVRPGFACPAVAPWDRGAPPARPAARGA